MGSGALSCVATDCPSAWRNGGSTRSIPILVYVIIVCINLRLLSHNIWAPELWSCVAGSADFFKVPDAKAKALPLHTLISLFSWYFNLRLLSLNTLQFASRGWSRIDPSRFSYCSASFVCTCIYIYLYRRVSSDTKLSPRSPCTSAPRNPPRTCTRLLLVIIHLQHSTYGWRCVTCRLAMAS